MAGGVTQEAWKPCLGSSLAVVRKGCGPLPPHLSMALSCDFTGLGKFKVTHCLGWRPSHQGWQGPTGKLGPVPASWQCHGGPSAAKAGVGPVPLFMGCVSNLLLAGRLAGCVMRRLLTPQLWSGLCRLWGNE